MTPLNSYFSSSDGDLRTDYQVLAFRLAPTTDVKALMTSILSWPVQGA